MTLLEEKNAQMMRSATPGMVHIGSGIKVRGTFEACDIAEIHGSLDGEIQTRELIIHEGGQLAGMAICEIARISGKLEVKSKRLNCYKSKTPAGLMERSAMHVS